MRVVDRKLILEKIVLDHDRNIILDEENSPLMNYQAYLNHSYGLKVLADTVRKEELDINLNGILFIMNTPPIINCAFDWFSISIVNYLRFVALVDLMVKNQWKESDLADPAKRKTIKTHCTDYVRDTIPEIQTWRDKVSAHFAATYPYKNDSLGTLLQSVMNPAIYLQPYFYAGGYQYCSQGSKSELPKWSLTEIYDKLCPRFWPHLKLKEIPKDKPNEEVGAKP
jgi:hypothetical protein